MVRGWDQIVSGCTSWRWSSTKMHRLQKLKNCEIWYSIYTRRWWWMYTDSDDKRGLVLSWSDRLLRRLQAYWLKDEALSSFPFSHHVRELLPVCGCGIFCSVCTSFASHLVTNLFETAYAGSSVWLLHKYPFTSGIIPQIAWAFEAWSVHQLCQTSGRCLAFAWHRYSVYSVLQSPVVPREDLDISIHAAC